MSRKALFANLGKSLGDGRGETAPETGAPVAAPAETSASAPRPRIRPILGAPELLKGQAAAPVGALGQSLSEFKAQSDRAAAIERRLAEGQIVVDLDPAAVEPSFICDRMATTSEAQSKLVEAIREHGQQAPILVRPHPTSAGRFQVAYGHRRLRAAIELQRTVRAVVKALSDEELVVAQGQENSERQDLSFIEKARFARRLEERGFRRDTIMSALSVYKSDLSNMLSVVGKIPEEVVEAIGPAPAIGRRGWIDLAELLLEAGKLDAVTAALSSPDFSASDSDGRFRRVYGLVKPRAEKTRFENWTTAGGAKYAKIVQNSEKMSVTINRRLAPGFSEFLLERLQSLYEEFEAER